MTQDVYDSNYLRPFSRAECNVTYEIVRNFANLIHLKNLIRRNSIGFYNNIVLKRTDCEISRVH